MSGNDRGCAVNGLPVPGGVCRHVGVGGRKCWYNGECEHQTPKAQIDELIARVERSAHRGDLRAILGCTKNDPEKRLRWLREYVEKNNL